MRLVSATVLAVLVALPLGAAAQDGDEAAPTAQLAFLPQHRLAPRLTLRASYLLFLDVDADTGAMSDPSEANADDPEKKPADGEVASPASKPQSSMSYRSPGTEVPDIETLSQRAIEHYELQSAQSHTRRQSQWGTGGRRPGAKAGIAIGVIVGVGLVVFGIAAAVAVSNWVNDP